jgi:hypothetical protein
LIRKGSSIDAASCSRRYTKTQSATVIIRETSMTVQKHFRKLVAPELLKDVFDGATYVDVIRVNDSEKEVAV